MQAMIFAAGLGTRLKPLTDSIPKALVEVEGQPLLRRTIIKLKEAGVDRIVVNVHHFADQIIDYLKANNNFGLDIRISDERENLLDTGGGLLNARSLFNPNEPILIHNVDILSNVRIHDFYYLDPDFNNVATLIVSRRQTKRYLVFDNNFKLKGWTNIETKEVKSPYPHFNIKTPGNNLYAFSGIHLVTPAIFPLLEDYAKTVAHSTKFSITDFYIHVCNTASINGYVKFDLQLLDVGKLDTLDKATEFVHQHPSEEERRKAEEEEEKGADFIFRP